MPQFLGYGAAAGIVRLYSPEIQVIPSVLRLPEPFRHGSPVRGIAYYSAMRRLMLMVVIAGTVACFAARWAIRQNQLAEDEADKSDWENEGGAVGPMSAT